MDKEQLNLAETTTNPLNTIPLYKQLRDVIIDRIRSKVWRPGHMVPNEVALSLEFQVSVGTIRKAMHEVSNRGLISRQQGRGTFVVDPLAAGTASILGRLRRPDGLNYIWNTSHVAAKIETAGAYEEALFGPPAMGPPQVLRFEWVVSADGRRAVLHHATVPSKLVALDIDQARHVDSLDELFDLARIVIDRIECALSVAPADECVADLLKLTPGTYLQRLDRRILDLQGRTVAVSEDWIALAGGVYMYTHQRPSG